MSNKYYLLTYLLTYLHRAMITVIIVKALQASDRESILSAPT